MQSFCVISSLPGVWSWVLLLFSFPETFGLSLNPINKPPSRIDDSIRCASCKPSSSPWLNNDLHFELERYWICSISEPLTTLLYSIPLQSGDYSSEIGFFANKSQAKRACRNGAIWILENSSSSTFGLDWLPKVQIQSPQISERTSTDSKQRISLSYSELMESPLIQASSQPSNMILQPGDQVWIMVDRRWSNNKWNGYPVSVTKHWLPPPNAYQSHMHDCGVVYEDDEIALIHKPDNLTTISSKSSDGTNNDDNNNREDLQSLLPFLLQYPRIVNHQKTKAPQSCYLPRPVHRLDKQTSGLVLVAKSARAMKFLSKAFAERQVTKTYSAIVVQDGGQEEEEASPWNNTSTVHSSGNGTWQRIDYPINGKSAVSSWRLVQSIPFLNRPLSKDGEDDTEKDSSLIRLSLLEVRPHTGRTHQIRRHLAYNLKSPIVGDTKYYYAAGGTNKDWHRNQARMYLHCHVLEFPYYNHQYYLEWKAANLARVSNLPSQEATMTLVPLSSNTEDATTNSGVQAQRKLMRISIPLPKSFHDRLQV